MRFGSRVGRVGIGAVVDAAVGAGVIGAAQCARRLERLVRRTRRRRIDPEFLTQSDKKWVQSRK
jgi:hypothetical protein